MKELKHCSPDQLYRLKPFLDKQVNRIEKPSFIDNDPIQFMYAFDAPEDQAIAGFFAALMAWGRRDVVITKVGDLLERMNYQPSAFIRNFDDRQMDYFDGFKHRTFKPVDIFWIVKCLQKIFRQYGSFESFWLDCYQISHQTGKELITVFHYKFLGLCDEIPVRTYKHISNPEKGSSCKRLYMYLRWMIRKDSPVDLGIMNFMDPSELIVPLDVHSARQARHLGLLTRRYNDWKAATELTQKLKLLDPVDPTKYDFALFGIGVQEGSIPDEFVINPSVK